MKKRPISWLVFVGLICLPYTVLADNGAVGIVSQNVGPAPRSSSDSELQAQINERMKYKNFIKEELTSLNEQIAQCQQEKRNGRPRLFWAALAWWPLGPSRLVKR